MQYDFDEHQKEVIDNAVTMFGAGVLQLLDRLIEQYGRDNKEMIDWGIYLLDQRIWEQLNIYDKYISATDAVDILENI